MDGIGSSPGPRAHAEAPDGAPESAPGDEEDLEAGGWERRFEADLARVEELEELYRSLGYEVRVRSLVPESFGPQCAGCALTACRRYVELYTRPAPPVPTPAAPPAQTTGSAPHSTGAPTMDSDLLDLIGQLEHEHDEVRAALARLDGLPAGADLTVVTATLGDLAPVLVAGLDQHSAAEDTILFPALGEGLGAAAEAFAAEHVDIRAWRDQLYQAATVAERLAAAAELRELLQAHMEREENMLFPSARDELTMGR